MTREQFEHPIRASGAVLGVTELLVIGRQAVHGSMTAPLPVEATRSVEVDVAVRGDVEGRLAVRRTVSSARRSCGAGW